MIPDPPLADLPVEVPVSARETVYSGFVWDIVRETFELPESARPLTRDKMAHPGAVAVAAVDDEDRILLLQQYRHPIRTRDWEVPAGLLDVSGEDPAAGAARELGEEADLRAEDWHTLADLFTSPGGSDERVRIYLARGVTAVPEEEHHEREDEESGIVLRWVPLDEARDAVLGGRVRNAIAALAVFHAHAARSRGWTGLRPADAPWEDRGAARS